MLRVAKRGQMQLLELLFADGFRILSRLSPAEPDQRFEEDPEEDHIQELDYLEALASPVYILAEVKFLRVDPVRRAFQHLYTCQELAKKMAAFGNALQAMKSQLQNFLLQLLSFCNGKEQVELFLDRDDDIDGLSIRDCSVMPRIHQAIRLDLQDFVTHDHCQQVVRSIFFDEEYDRVKDRGVFVQSWYFLIQVVLIPFYSVMFILAMVKERCEKNCCEGWEKDFEKEEEKRLIGQEKKVFKMT